MSLRDTHNPHGYSPLFKGVLAVGALLVAIALAVVLVGM